MNTPLESLDTSTIPNPDHLAVGLKWSAIGHLVLLLFILIKSLIFPGKPLPYIPTLKVDLVGLPDILKKDLPQIQHRSQLNSDIARVLKQAEADAKHIQSKSHETSKEMAKKEEMVIHPKDSPQKSIGMKNKRALDRLKALNRIQDVSNHDETPSHTLIKGNKLSAGGSLSGEAKEAAQASYTDILLDRLKENWNLPAWLARQKSFTAQVRVYIDSKGNLRQMKFVKFSGNEQFDDAVKRAIQESLPFPTPPSELESTLLSDGIFLGFPL